jgi:serine/threonine-protein kinase RsbT
MNLHYQKTLKTLERFLSPATARALLTRSLKEQGLSSSNITPGDLVRMSNGLRRGVRLFVDPAQREEAEREIASYCGGGTTLPESVTIDVASENDISRVRALTRKLCTSCGASPYSMQKVATVVSELARNIVLYAGRGELSITPKQKTNGDTLNPKTAIVICANDRGPGIPDIDHILSGKYRSQTGLGKGLLGTQRLAESFHVVTGSGGTTITAEIVL